jgi:hypothetical protein
MGHRRRKKTICKFENCHFGTMVANKCKITETVENNQTANEFATIGLSAVQSTVPLGRR